MVFDRLPLDTTLAGRDIAFDPNALATRTLVARCGSVMGQLAAMMMMTDQLYNELIRTGATAVLKPAGFRKAGSNFHRRVGTCVQVVNFQVSRGSTPDVKVFYVNVGLAFDGVCELTKKPILDNPKEYECDGRGTRDRLEALLPGVDIK